jgi:hypothetical protein
MVFFIVSYLNAMPPTPLVEWEEQEIADGAVKFADQIQRLLNHTIPSAPLTTTEQPFVKKISKAVAYVVPQLTDVIQRELQTTPPVLHSIPPSTVVPVVSTTAITSPASTTALPPCGSDPVQVI